MANIAYEVIQHDGGWAYELAGSFSETFATHQQALAAAGKAAAEQVQRGDNTEITYQDSAGELHHEIADGNDRPDPVVVDKA